MDFFESPAWDGDQATENLTTELFRPLNVGRVKVPKIRKRNKYPKGTPNSLASNSGKSEKVKVSPSPGKPKSFKPIPATISKAGDAVSIGEDNGSIPKKKNKVKVKSGASKENGVELEKNVERKIIKKSPEVSSNPPNEGNDSKPTSNCEPTNPTKPKKKKKKRKKKIEPVCENNEESLPEVSRDLKDSKEQLDLVASKHPNNEEGVHDRDNEINNLNVKGIGKGSDKVGEIIKSGNSINDNPEPSKKRKKNKVKQKVPKKVDAGEVKGDEVPPHPIKGNHESVSGLIESNLSSGNIGANGVVVKKKKKKSRKNKSLASKESREETVGADPVGAKKSPQDSKKTLAEAGKKRKQPEESRSPKKKMKKSKEETEVDEEDGTESEDESETPPTQKKKRKLSPEDDSSNISNSENDVSASAKKKNLSLRDKMMDKLRAARFRYMNEEMYTSPSGHTNKVFQVDQDAFKAYHDGYKQQLMQWPVKPVDLIIKSLNKKPPSLVIADFGCGDAKISRSLKNKVHSFDHIALNKHVTACDMAHTPLPDASVDVAVFCLSLMGKNLSEYIFEANRVLKNGGLLKIAEVESRFDEVEKFVRDICKFGFLCFHRDTSNDFFYLFDFRKEKSLKPGAKLPTIELRACTYKKR